MKNLLLLALAISIGCTKNTQNTNSVISTTKVIVETGLQDNKLSDKWISALKRRMSKTKLDSVAQISWQISEEESKWVQLISSKQESWNQLKDSLKVPFGDIMISDTTYVLLGFSGEDDGFTYQFNTVCFDVTALNNTYGSASKAVNNNRIDRLFAHEYTHLLHKEWVRQTNYEITSFKDSILWECMYEGIGMYRSMSAKWFPVGNELSEKSAETFTSLYPQFAERLITIERADSLSTTQKKQLHHHLSKGPMHKKWGALLVGVWLAMEAQGDDRKLQQWVSKGHEAIIPLALKYLEGEQKEAFREVFGESQ